jgi:hypothetical protein
MVLDNAGYYINSLKAWKDDFERQQKASHSRLRALQRQKHPCTEQQQKLIDMRQAWINQIDAELSAHLSQDGDTAS